MIGFEDDDLMFKVIGRMIINYFLMCDVLFRLNVWFFKLILFIFNVNKFLEYIKSKVIYVFVL